ncbi:MAG: hypothetical protein ACI31R_05500 [Bacilli bacterium]
MTRLEQRKNSVEKTLKDFNIPYVTEYDRRFFKIKYQGIKLTLEVTNRYISITNRKQNYNYGYFEGVTDFRKCIEEGNSLID